MNIFYYLFFCLIFSAKILGLYDGQKPFYVFVGIGLLFYVLKLVTTKMTALEYGVTALLMGMGALVYVFSGEKGLLLCMAIVTGMKAVDHVKLLKLTAFGGSALFLIMVLLTSLGILPDGHHITGKFGGLILRRDFGQPGSNVTHTVLFVLLSLVLFLYGQGQHLFKLSVFCMILNACCFAFTLSITGFLSITILLVISLVFSRIEKTDNTRFVYTSIALFFLIAAFSIVLPLLVKGKVFDILNKILNHRLEYGRYYLLNENISLFGSRFAAAPNVNYYLDNSFLYLFLQLGVITFFITLLVLFIGLNGMLKNNDRGALMLFAAYTFIGLSDPFLFNTAFKNMTLIFVGKYFFEYLERVSDGKELKARSLIKINEPKLGSRIYAWIDRAIDCIRSSFDTNSNLLLILFAILPIIGVGIYYLFPQLFDVSLLAAGDRLVYDYEAEVQLNHDINRMFCVLRTGVLDGLFVAIAITIGKVIHGRHVIYDNHGKLQQ